MIIKALVENTKASDNLGCEHGLSLYIETNNCKILFDTGASDLFFKNAQKMGVIISDVDFLVISHGHYDHGGGLETFLNENTKAKIYIRKEAFGKHYSMLSGGELKFIGINNELINSERMVITSDNFEITKGVRLFANIKNKDLIPISNSGMFTNINGEIVKDTFVHEQNLIIEENGKVLLLVGCAHNGIVNILEHYQSLRCNMPDYVIGGFHLSSNSSGGYEKIDVIDDIGKYLINTNAMFYTCHCTGIKPYQRLKFIMGDMVQYLNTGSEIII